jgi:ABC-2 type transport system permease protein
VIIVELIKMLRRPRTWLIMGMLIALPTLVAVLLAVTDLGPRPGTGPPFLSAVLSDGTLFPLAALGVVLPLLLPIAVAALGGDAIAGESQTGTLR